MLKNNIAEVLFNRPMIALDSSMVKECEIFMILYNKVKKLEDKTNEQ